jgi:hypothetical protein
MTSHGGSCRRGKRGGRGGERGCSWGGAARRSSAPLLQFGLLVRSLFGPAAMREVEEKEEREKKKERKEKNKKNVENFPSLKIFGEKNKRQFMKLIKNYVYKRKICA